MRISFASCLSFLFAIFFFSLLPLLLSSFKIWDLVSIMSTGSVEHVYSRLLALALSHFLLSDWPTRRLARLCPSPFSFALLSHVLDHFCGRPLFGEKEYLTRFQSTFIRRRSVFSRPAVRFCCGLAHVSDDGFL